MRMTGYTKLFGTILASSVWQESNETRIVWITMLAAANKWGVVEAAVPGLAHMAKLTVPETVEALRILEEPDPYSRTPDFEGRRIKPVDGGWQILNHDKYKEKMGVDERREYNRQKQAEFRERQREREASKKRQTKSITVNHGQSESALSAHSDSDVQSKADVHPSTSKTSVPLEPPPNGGEVESEYSPEFELFWKSYPRKTGKGKAWKAWSGAKKRPSLETLTAAVDLQKETEQWRRDNGKYIPHPATWLNDRRWQDEVDLKLGVQTNQPKHKAYCAEDATRGLTTDEICKF